jgi:hypothetical protein
VAQTNTLDTYFGKVQKQVCVAGVGVPVLAAVQVPTLGELSADAAARASERLSERIAKAESLGIAWAPVMALLTLESDRRLRARRAASALLGTGATMPVCPCLICSRRTVSCACLMFRALACCEHTLDIECRLGSVASKGLGPLA